MSPTMEQVAQIHRRWIAQGRPRCEHEKFSSETYPGGHTDDYACHTCGVQWPRNAEKPPPTGEGTGEDW